MKNYTESELEENYKAFLKFIEDTFEGERQEKLLYMYGTDDGCLGLRALIAPASGTIHYHNCYDGGYIDHVMNVCKAAMGQKVLLQSLGARIDFTDDELMFSALNHDLGKLGSLDGEQYQRNDSEWHVKNQGKVYKMNTDLHWMGVTDRSLFLLQHFEIKYNQKECLAIKLSDGMYDDANIDYLKSFNPGNGLKTELPRVVHWADHMSCVLEKSLTDQNFKFE
jgi:hypothetical protein